MNVECLCIYFIFFGQHSAAAAAGPEQIAVSQTLQGKNNHNTHSHMGGGLVKKISLEAHPSDAGFS